MHRSGSDLASGRLDAVPAENRADHLLGRRPHMRDGGTSIVKHERSVKTESTPTTGDVPVGEIVVVDRRRKRLFTGVFATRRVCMEVPLFLPLGLLLYLPPILRIVGSRNPGCNGDTLDSRGRSGEADRIAPGSYPGTRRRRCASTPAALLERPPAFRGGAGSRSGAGCRNRGGWRRPARRSIAGRALATTREWKPGRPTGLRACQADSANKRE